MRFRATILSGGKTATGIPVPDDVVEALGKRAKVRVTLNGAHTYRSSIASMGGRYLISLSAENREKAGVAAGDEIDVEVALDTEVREVELAPDFAAALEAEPAAKVFFTTLSYSNKRWHTLSIDGAKTDETRQRRIVKSVAMLKEGRAR